MRPLQSAPAISSSAGRSRAKRTKRQGEAEAEIENGGETNGAALLTPERFEAMQDAEQVILTVSENGYGKRTSSFEYRVTGRGGKGVVAMAVNDRNGSLVASFPVEDSDEIMLVTDGGQLIRMPVAGIRIAGRATQGVIVFDTDEAGACGLGRPDRGSGRRRGRRGIARSPARAQSYARQ